jgi:hypothetical protein
MTRALLLVLVLGLAGCASWAPGGPERGYGYAAGASNFGPPQGGGGGGGLSNPLTEDLDADGHDLIGLAGLTAKAATDLTILGSGDIEITRPGGDAYLYLGVDNAQLSGDDRVDISAPDIYLGSSASETTTVNGPLVAEQGISIASGKGITNALHVVKVRRVANQALTTATLTDISWDTEDVDTGGYSAVGGGANVKAFTASEDMTVTITTQVNFTVDGTGIRRFFLTRYNSSDVGQDGTQWGQDASTASAGGYNLNHVGTVTFTFVMGAGDYIKVRAEQTRGSDLNVTASLHAVRAR